MDVRIISLAIERDTDIIAARQRTRKIAAELNFDAQDQTRITTAVSEIVRNALEYGSGGRVEFWLDGPRDRRCLAIVVTDHGKGVDAEGVLSGRIRSKHGLGVGIAGARRLVDDFSFVSTHGKGVTVRMRKLLPVRAPTLTSARIERIARDLSAERGIDPLAEIQRQNQDLMLQFQELQRRHEQVEALNAELQDTNRGVVALYAELDERADHLRRADQLKSRFLSNMSHEFRTPLNSILSLARLLLLRTDGELTLEQERQIQFIRKSAETLSEIVNDLLDLAKVEAGKVVVTPKEFLAADLLGALRGMLRPLLVGDGVTLNFDDIGEDLPALHTDEGKVSQILRNFLSNAIKFTERGEIRVWIEFDRVADMVSFHVRDSGIGIAPKDQEVIWQEFGQVQNRLQSKVKGTGLGLPLSKKLAEVLGGSVAVQSAPGQGSIFSLSVPRVFAGVKSPEEISPEVQLDPDLIPVLIVEDDPADTFSIERALSRSRYQPFSLRTVAEARRFLAATKPAAILLDVVLAAEDTWKLLLELKHDERTQAIPVIVISTTQEHHKARGLGAYGYLSKPVDPQELVEILDEATGRSTTTKVLLIDDEEISRYLIRQLLPRGAFALKEASDATQVVSMVSSERPDVVLLDLNMGGRSGAAILEEFSALNAAPPTIIITSAILDDATRGTLRKAKQILSKYDLTTEALVHAIRQAIDAPVQKWMP